MTTKNRKVFFLYTIVISILVITGFIVRYGFENKPGYKDLTRIYNAVEFTLLAYFFSLNIKNSIVKKILLYSPIPFIIFCVFDYLKAKESSLPFIPLAIEYLTLLVFIIYYFFEVMQESVVEPIYNKAIFWISVAFIINFSGNFLLFVYSQISDPNDEAFQKQYTIIYTTVTIVKNILLCIGMTLKENKKKDHYSDSMLPGAELDAFYPFNKNLN
jgi:hypothetical protein